MNIKHNLIGEVLKVYKSNRHGSPTHRRERQRTLINMINDLIYLGIAPPYFQQFNEQHLSDLIAYWRKNGNSVSTIRNKIGVLKWFFKQKGIEIAYPMIKTSHLAQQNQQSSIPSVSPDLITRVHHPFVRTIIEFQFYFGLTKMEAARIDLTNAMRSDELYIARHLAHNKKERFIPVATDKQQQAIDYRRKILDRNRLIDELPERMLMNLYLAELYYCGVHKSFDLRVYFANQKLALLERQGLTENQAYRIVMGEMGFITKANFQRLILWANAP